MQIIPENPRWYAGVEENFVSFSDNSSSGEETDSRGVLLLISGLSEGIEPLVKVEVLSFFGTSSVIGSMFAIFEKLKHTFNLRD